MEVARFLWQRVERGEGPFIFDSYTRKQVVTVAREARRRGGSRPPTPEEPASASRSREDAPVARPTHSGEDASVAPGAPSRESSPAKPPLSSGASTPSRSADPASLLVLPDTLDGVREVALGCVRCRLSETRTQVVFSDGVPDPRVLVLGEAPGQNEDQTGLPFVGAAGKLLDLLLASVGVSRRENAYICNVIKCRPPGNRNPLPDEIETCTPFLKSQVALVAPEVILAVGTFAGQWVTGQQLPLGKLRGSVYSYEGIPVVVTYHPAALLRNSGWTRATWDDLQLLCSVLDGA